MNNPGFNSDFELIKGGDHMIGLNKAKPFNEEIEQRIIKAEMQEFVLFPDDSIEITNAKEQLNALW